MPGREPETITIDTWKEWTAQGRHTQLIDVRSATEFAVGHLPGAINIPLEQVELRTADLDADAPVVLVCQGGTRARWAHTLLANSSKHLVVLDGGTDAWAKADNPLVRSTAARWALERQVRLVAGSLVVLGTGLGLAISSRWLIVPAFVGCGLAFAGISGICPMGELLARLPWNRTRRSSLTAPTPSAGVGCACEFPKRP
ncbi:MAG TPA: rhodanese-like domain-containing protein [Terracidiphilus sp.]|jgi:rhodanese-related sulfurtransferase|nr:rhodanese-like domain-containing protein [Terracidiphilus sp.]